MMVPASRIARIRSNADRCRDDGIGQPGQDLKRFEEFAQVGKKEVAARRRCFLPLWQLPFHKGRIRLRITLTNSRLRPERLPELRESLPSPQGTR
jgi:hypothetical protein